MPEDEESLRLLVSIDRRLALLSASHEHDLRRALADQLLRTEARKAMFAAIDGQRNATEIAKEAGGVGVRTAQLFVNELLEMGLVRKVASSSARSVIVERDEDAIVQWYVSGVGRKD